MTDPIAQLRTALADRYRIERELGHGGMATVYLAEDLKHRRQVALKVLRPELAAILGAERFLQEIQVTANLQHPNILPLYDSGEAGGRLYYVMPYVEGESLADRLKREKQLGVDESVRIIESVAAALQYAHDHGVVHRDIKPANILLQSGQALVADFGIALAVRQAGGTRLTETGLSLGTPHYMSPEQATGDRELDARSDVYSLGAVLYEMLAGDPPHLGSTVQAIVAKVLSEPPASLQRSRPSVPAHVDAAVQQALAKIPADRFPTAAAFGAALGNPAFTGAQAGHAGVSAGRSGWRNPVTLALAGLALVFGALAVWSWTRPRPEPQVLRYRMSVPPDQAINMAAPAIGRRLTLSPDGTRLAYVGPSELSGAYQLWLLDRDQLNARPIPGTDNGRRPFFSPDGNQVGFFTGDNLLRVVSLTGEPPTTVNAQDLDAGGGAWGDDGYLYAASRGQGLGSDRGLVRVPAAGGPVEVVTTRDSTERQHVWPVALPGGRGVLFSVSIFPGAAGYRLAVVDLRTRKHHQLVEAMTGWFAASGHLLYVTADGSLIAAPFDQDKLEITGPGRVMQEGVGVNGLGVDLTLSRTGTLMYLTGTSGLSAQPMWVSPDGAATPVDPQWSFQSSALYSTLALSPDATRLLVNQEDETGQQLWVKQLPRGPSTKLTFEGALNSRASWTADSRSVVFISDRGGGNQVWRQVADGSAPAELVSPRSANEGFLTPDGAWFVFRGVAGDRHIYAVRTSGDSSVVEIARSARGEDVAPALSPDGKWIAYVSDESGRDEVYVRPFPDASRAKRQVSAQGGLEPRWSPDGRMLYYRNAADQLVAVPVERAGEGFTPGTERVLFSMSEYLPANRFQPTYAVDRAGGRFVLLRRTLDTDGLNAGGLVVIENFLQDVRQRLRP